MQDSFSQWIKLWAQFNTGGASPPSSFVIVGRGIHIAFFSYLSDSGHLTRKNIPNHKGLIPLYLNPPFDKPPTCSPSNTTRFLEAISCASREAQDEVLLTWVEDEQAIHSFFSYLRELPTPSISTI